MRTPMAASFSTGPTHTPVRPGDASGHDTDVAGGANQHLFEIAHVAMDVAAGRAANRDGIADDLAGAVVGDVAAAAGFKTRRCPLPQASLWAPSRATGLRRLSRRASGREDARRAGAGRRCAPARRSSTSARWRASASSYATVSEPADLQPSHRTINRRRDPSSRACA